jgi:RES domain-containing protein
LTLLLPAFLGGPKLVAWRLDRAEHASNWDSGEGAYRPGGRWNSRGVRAVYCSIDASTAILEVAVHAGFRTLDTVPYVLTAIDLAEAELFVVQPADVPNANWLVPGVPSAGQQEFGDGLLAAHKFILIPSAASNVSWNIIFVASKAAGAYKLRSQERFALDTRLHRP